MSESTGNAMDTEELRRVDAARRRLDRARPIEQRRQKAAELRMHAAKVIASRPESLRRFIARNNQMRRESVWPLRWKEFGYTPDQPDDR